MQGGRQDTALLADFAHRAKRLLLLSATPVLHHEAAFLAMLHLLDPDAYALEDLDGFRRARSEASGNR